MTQPAPYNTGAAVAPQQKTNTMAIVSLIGAFFVSLVGIICGHIALKQIRETGEGGRGLAMAGLIIGYIGLAIGIIWVIVLFATMGAAISNS